LMKSSSPSFKLILLTMHFPWAHFKPASITAKLDESIQSGTWGNESMWGGKLNYWNLCVSLQILQLQLLLLFDDQYCIVIHAFKDTSIFKQTYPQIAGVPSLEVCFNVLHVWPNVLKREVSCEERDLTSQGQLYT
jgi:hypothetical protein